MSLSLVFETAKHRMLILHAAVLSPPQEQKSWQNAEEGTLMTDLQREDEAPGLELKSYVQMLVFQEQILV